MFANINKKRVVSNIVRLEITFMLGEIARWIKNDYQGDLLNEERLDRQKNHYGDLTYQFDILPHPNGKDSIIYHRYKNQFSPYLDAFHDFDDSVYNARFLSIKNIIDGVSWDTRLGLLGLWVLPTEDASKNLIVVPTNEIFILQHSHGIFAPFDLDGIKTFEETGEDAKEKTIDVAISPEESIKINRRIDGLGLGSQVTYRNILCQVAAYRSQGALKY